VLTSSIVVLAMSGGVAAAAADTKSVLVVDKIAEVDFGPISGTRVGAVSVGTTSDRRVWFTAQDALQFASGGASDGRARQVHEVRAFVKISETGEGKLLGDEAGEHVQGLARDTVGHHYHIGKEHEIARVGFNLELLSQAAAKSRRPPERVVVGAAAAAHSEGRNRQVTLGKSFWGPLKTGSLITVGGFVGSMGLQRDVECGCLTTLDGQPITGRRQGFVGDSQLHKDVSRRPARCAEPHREHDCAQTRWYHGTCPFTA